MKKATFTIILFAAFGLVTTAQDAPKKPLRNNIQKGYYSIGNNAEKLASNINPVVLTKTRTVKEPATKGYSAIEARERSVIVVDLPANKTKPTKGYYSIDSQRSPY